MRNTMVLSTLVVMAGLVSLGGECGSTRSRHSVVAYNGTVTVYKSNKANVALFLTANDTISGNFTTRGEKPVDLFVLDTFNFRRSTHDSAHSVFARTNTGNADIFFSSANADTFKFEFVNRDPDSLRSVTLYLNRVYWETSE
jgi:hypothetical protein